MWCHSGRQANKNKQKHLSPEATWSFIKSEHKNQWLWKQGDWGTHHRGGMMKCWKGAERVKDKLDSDTDRQAVYHCLNVCFINASPSHVCLSPDSSNIKREHVEPHETWHKREHCIKVGFFVKIWHKVQGQETWTRDHQLEESRATQKMRQMDATVGAVLKINTKWIKLQMLTLEKFFYTYTIWWAPNVFGALVWFFFCWCKFSTLVHTESTSPLCSSLVQFVQIGQNGIVQWIMGIKWDMGSWVKLTISLPVHSIHNE